MKANGIVGDVQKSAEAVLPPDSGGTTTVRELLEGKKRRGVVVARPQTSVFDALTLMAEHDVGALVVIDADHVVGVVSERDYARKVILLGKSSRETPVAQIMSAPAVTVGPDTTVAECMALMTGRFVRHLPVLDLGVLVGLVSIGDVVKTIIAEQSERIGSFKAYISGTYPA